MDKFVEEILSHHGVKGMRWGVRKRDTRPTSDDFRRHAAAKRKHVSELDDKELRAVLDRINMEQRFNKINPGKVKKGHETVKAVLAVGATINAVAAFTATPTGRVIAKTLGRKVKKATTLFPTLGA